MRCFGRPAAFAPLALIALAACGGGIESNVRSAADASQPPSDLLVVFDDRHPSRGGERIEVHGDGRIRVARFRVGGDEVGQRWSGRIPETALHALVDLLVDIEAWAQREEDEPGRLEDAKATLSIRVGGERSRIWEWATDLESRGRISRVKQHLDALAFDARHPVLEGGVGAMDGRAP